MLRRRPTEASREACSISWFSNDMRLAVRLALRNRMTPTMTASSNKTDKAITT
jgi:hypothetical protein